MAKMKQVLANCLPLVEAGIVNRYSSVHELKEVYKEFSKNWKVVGYNTGRTRNWGAGVNETFKAFKAACAILIFDVCEWPTTEDPSARDIMAEYHVQHEHMPHVRWLQEHGLWEDWHRLRTCKSRTSWQFWDDINFYVRVVEMIGVQALNKHPRWWHYMKFFLPLPENWPITPAPETYRKVGRMLDLGYKLYHTIEKALRIPDEAFEEAITQYGANYEVWEIAQLGVIPKQYLKKWYNKTSCLEDAVPLLKSVTKWTPNPSIDAIGFASIEIKLYCGMKPIECIDPCLRGLFTNKMAHELIFEFLPSMLKSGYKPQSISSLLLASKYIEAKCGLPERLFFRIRTYDKLLIDWLARKWQNPVMSKQRTLYGPNDYVRHYTYLDILDELQPEDLVNGIDTKPDAAFRNSAGRLEAQYKASLGEAVMFRNSPFEDTEGIKFINNSVDLITEGKLMHHCVGGYLKACIASTSLIYHVNVKNQQSTLEIGRANAENKWRLVQNKSHYNADPGDDNWKTVLSWCKRHGIEAIRK